MSGDQSELDLASAVAAARREYEHQKECILQYLSDCKQTAEDKKAGGKLTENHHYGAEFDTFTIERTSTAFLAVSDVRMQVGSSDEQIAVAELLFQFRSLLPIAPLTTALADVVRGAGSRQGTPGARKRTLDKQAKAERVRDIIEGAKRKPDRPHLFADPVAVLDAVRSRLKKPGLDRNTLAGYRQHVDSTVKIDGSPDPD